MWGGWGRLQVDDLINIFSEPAKQNATNQKLSLSTLQFNIMRVILAMLPVFHIIRRLIGLFRWERPAASLLALIVCTLLFPPSSLDAHCLCRCLFSAASSTSLHLWPSLWPQHISWFNFYSITGSEGTISGPFAFLLNHTGFEWRFSGSIRTWRWKKSSPRKRGKAGK